MSGYFSFQKFITKPFVRAVYVLGFLALTSAGIAFTAWAIQGLQSGALPRRPGFYYLAIGIGAVTVGNLVWRVFCEFWVVLFNIHARLVSIDRGLGRETIKTPPLVEEVDNVEDKREKIAKPIQANQDSFGLARPSSMLGLS